MMCGDIELKITLGIISVFLLSNWNNLGPCTYTLYLGDYRKKKTTEKVTYDRILSLQMYYANVKKP